MSEFNPGARRVCADSAHPAVPFLFSSPPVLTPDSDYGDPVILHDKYRVYRVAAPLWLPPVNVGRMLGTSLWEVNIEYVPDGGLEGGGTWTEEVTAGTERRVEIDGGVPTTTVINTPGWETLTDAINAKRHRKPSPDEADQETLPCAASLVWTSVEDLSTPGDTLEMAVTLNIEGWVPAWYATDLPTSGPPHPKWTDRTNLEECWMFVVSCSAEAIYYVGGVPSGDSRSTQLVTYDGSLIGRIENYPSADNGGDATWTISLSHQAYHTDP